MARVGGQPLDSVSIASLRSYIAVVEAKSFSVAARQLRLATSTVSKHVVGLERDLGYPLIYRNTRRANVTEAGERFYQRCKSILFELDEAVSRGDTPAAPMDGHLRITVPPSFATAVLSPMLPTLLGDHPGLSVDLIVTSALPDFIRERIDLAILLRETLPTKFPSRRLCANPRVFCASPGYLDAHGVPQTPEDLAAHRCIVSLISGEVDPWMIRQKGIVKPMPMSGQLASDNGNLLKLSCLSGCGIGNFYRFHVYKELASGALVEILPDYQCQTNNIYAVLPHRQLVPPRTQAFLEHIADRIGSPPFWLAG
ncbi:LysR substrate-binding domain-containing protein [Acuticoccus sp. M5D2P5]|uniref:LysR family transcriptional regulator n=1 Tax=Acuticoccus kalidii TaxID=2910977 RepID=UPI001F423A69|nr:LysR family transcriptional regulator [Acuticoccus kalidii]MCF3933169.1 LysR substrate-binding domain-containing protein [Acuticoccus kalidii]